MQKGLVIWFTGLSGAGKTTIATEVEKLLSKQGLRVCMLDGDVLRQGINSDLGFSDEDRNENVRRAAEIAKLFCDKEFIVLVSFISPFAAMRERAGQIIGRHRFIEVYVKADINVCRERDPKNLYKKNIAQFTGISSAYEVPKKPDLILDTQLLSIEESANLVFEKIRNQYA
ncbi:MAG: adenylyl-sulfate kinase [Fibromonadales bacterium]|nr:adenylyl-sulfate kinase [Fibromonadales bacterium]